MDISLLSKKENPFYSNKKVKKGEIALKNNDAPGNLNVAINGTTINNIEKLLLDEIGEEAYHFINRYVDTQSGSTLLTSTTTKFNIDKYATGLYQNVVNIQLVNNTRWINKFFESVNSKLPVGGVYIGTLEAKANRKRRILNALPRPFNWALYTIDFLHKRVAPKIKWTQRIYFYFTKGNGRVITRAETLGRLVSCGFEIVNHQDINNKTWFVVRKVKEPEFNLNPSYGPIFKMPRVGKGGKPILVYKFRTMHPYSEYLQDYVLKMNGYSEIGKPADDFRLTTWGKFMRRYWLDEMPQLINVLKGEMKLVGIRPLSKRFLAEYPEDVLKMRFKHKPGCVPPYVALLKQEVKEYIESERTYLLEVEKHPYTTDWKYFFKAVYNILTNKIRSS
jgi:lipopolysaccharide/colanic/teichoic acid biosynthesis glycosyltransferase